MRLTLAMPFIAAILAAPLSAQLKDPLLSPLVHPDRTVGLALNAAGADSVKAVGQFPGAPAVMAKDAEGVWHTTLGPLEPGVYFYSFQVNGLNIIDPSSRMVHRGLVPNTSVFIVPGAPPRFYEERDVPRGTFHTHRHRSAALGDRRSYVVYTPPGYGANADRRYPVLYLLHGYTDTEETWRTSGLVGPILDNLIAAKRAEPMIVVMPYGYAPPQPGDGEGGWMDWFARVTPRFAGYVTDELVGLIDGEYLTVADARHRAVAGLSMGGGQTLSLGLGHPETFAWIGAFSSAVSGDVHGLLLADANRLNGALSLLWIGCGKDDFLYQPNLQFIGQLKERGVDHVAHIGEGGHTWPIWHGYLREFAVLLFK